MLSDDERGNVLRPALEISTGIEQRNAVRLRIAADRGRHGADAAARKIRAPQLVGRHALIDA
jgi:hypothetical protein